jgi:hypothetical protein
MMCGDVSHSSRKKQKRGEDGAPEVFIFMLLLRFADGAAGLDARGAQQPGDLL